MMSVGVLLETFLVRSLLIPSLISAFGRTSMWPGRVRRRPEPDEVAEPVSP
jgi:RND superfamily putative drug exporter